MGIPRNSVEGADGRAWAIFFEALDADSPIAAAIPSGAAIIGADAPDTFESVRRYHEEGRDASSDGRYEIRARTS